MSGLKNKVVLITGSSSGIGAQTAVEFAKLGSKVVLTARRRDKLSETAQKCQDVGLHKDEILIVEGDIMKDGDLQHLVQATINTFGRIDVLVNNAGSAISKDLHMTSADDLDLMYRMHVRSVFLLTKLAMPHILKTKGNIVNVSSIASVRPLAHILPYSIAKCAQDQLMKAAAIELGPKGVRLNSVCPGGIKTDIFNEGWGTLKVSQLFEEMAVTHPAKRMGYPEEVAKAIVFLASDDASFVSGVNLPVDSGRYNTSWLPASRM